MPDVGHDPHALVRNGTGHLDGNGYWVEAVTIAMDSVVLLLLGLLQDRYQSADVDAAAGEDTDASAPLLGRPSQRCSY